MEYEVCFKCHGNPKGFIDERDSANEHEICPICNGEGVIPVRYFVEFLFSTPNGRRYWLPLFYELETIEEVKRKMVLVKKKLEEKFVDVEFSPRIVKETEMTRFYINEKFNLHSRQKLAILQVNEHRFKDIETSVELNFDQQMDYIYEKANSLADTRIGVMKPHQFRIRVVSEGEFPYNATEYLVIDIVGEPIK